MDKVMEYSLWKGFSFSFYEGEKHIKAWFSSFSGLEKVFVDGELVSSKRNMSTQTTHTFHIGENEYSIDFNVEHIFKGPYVCTLSKNRKPYQRQKLVFPKRNFLRIFIKEIKFYIPLGLVVIVINIFWRLPKPSFDIFFAVVFFVAIVYRFNLTRNKGVIEEEHVE